MAEESPSASRLELYGEPVDPGIRAFDLFEPSLFQEPIREVHFAHNVVVMEKKPEREEWSTRDIPASKFKPKEEELVEQS
jgi:hypothetical protein